jgi:dolichol kinase
MGNDKPKELVNKLLHHVELLVYAVLAAFVVWRGIGWIESYILTSLLASASILIVSSNQPHLTHVLLSFPLLCLASDLGNIYYAITTSLVSALTLQGRSKGYLDFQPYQLAAVALFASISGLGLSHPYMDAVINSAPVQTALSSPQGRLALLGGAGLVLQWITMQFFLKISFASFTNAEVVIVSQLCGGFMIQTLGKASQASSLPPPEYAVLFVAVVTWIGFWFYEFVMRLPQPMGVKLTLASSIAVLLSSIGLPLFLAAPSQLISFFTKHVNYMLLGIWGGLFVAFTALVAAIKSNVSNTILRKSFHFMALSMFLPAMVFDPGFLRTAMSLAIAVFCLVEFIRYSKILGREISDMISRAMDQVTNDRDRAGALTFSHAYLLVGCGFPLLFASSASEAAKLPLEVMAGPLCVLAIGDSFASIIGSKWGRHKWPSTNRSLEGTLAGIAATLGAIYALSFAFALNPDWISIVISTSLTFAMEAYTQSIDNLILPIFYHTSVELLR